MTFSATDSQKQQTHVWLTPLKLIQSLGEFDLDPCAYPDHCTAKKLIYPPENGLDAAWGGRVWLNPPYGVYARLWLMKLSEHGNGIALLFNRIGTKWMKPFLNHGFFGRDTYTAIASPKIFCFFSVEIFLSR